MPGQPQSERASQPRPRGVLIGIVLFVLGLAFVIADITPFFAGDHNTPLWLNLACLLVPIGFAVAGWSGLRIGREQQRAAVRELHSTANHDVAE
ncbi:MAG: hypothetical protein ABI232_05345 [Jatrophihabitantaceae bacterium]